MGFTTTLFWIFLFIVFFVYFLSPKKYQWCVLLVASYIFYLFSGFGTVVFLLLTTTITFYTGLLIEKADANFKEIIEEREAPLSKEEKKNYKVEVQKRKRTILIVAVLLVFGILGILKYYNFIAQNTIFLSKLLSINITLTSLEFLLPLGISFYTFQSVSYVIDIHRGKIRAEKDFAKFALFLSFFPQLVQGPISRYDQLAHQLVEHHSFRFDRLKFGMQLVLWGFFKKLVIADRLKIAVDTIFLNSYEFEGLSILIGMIFFSFQIYCDFSGGIDIARGISEAMGINLMENFKRPFFSKSIDEYWRRWHITLGSWMRDYVFYPLSLSSLFTKIGRFFRKIFGTTIGKMIPTLIATIITFLAVGLWHGPYWKYVAFGLYYGILISLSKLLSPYLDKLLYKYKIKTNCFSWQLIKISFVFTATTIGRYFVRADGFRHALFMLRRTLSTFNPWILYDGTLLRIGLHRGDYYVLIVSISILIIAEILQEKGVYLRSKLAEQNLVFRWIVYLIGIFSVLIFGVYGLEYDAADFIYRGF